MARDHAGMKRLRQQRNLAREALLASGSADFKPMTSARWVHLERQRNGVILVQIEHDTLKGVSSEMMLWWFRNLGQTTQWNGIDFSGPEISVYHLWHHRDHVAVTQLSDGADGETNRGFRKSAKSRIQEVFNDYRSKVDAEATTIELNDAEFTLIVSQFGMTVAKLAHHYNAEGNDLRFFTESHIGSRLPVVGPLFNWLILPWLYSLRKGEEWIRHNIEESGQTEKFVPVLYKYHLEIEK